MGALMLLLCFSLCGKTYAVSDLPAVSGTAEEYDITLMAVGDNLLHMGIVNTGIQSDGTRNYDFLFDGIRSFLDQADIKDRKSVV